MLKWGMNPSDSKTYMIVPRVCRLLGLFFRRTTFGSTLWNLRLNARSSEFGFQINSNTRSVFIVPDANGFWSVEWSSNGILSKNWHLLQLQLRTYELSLLMDFNHFLDYFDGVFLWVLAISHLILKFQWIPVLDFLSGERLIRGAKAKATKAP